MYYDFIHCTCAENCVSILAIIAKASCNWKNGLCCTNYCWGVYEQNSTVNSVRVGDWTAKLAIIASIEVFLKFVYISKILKLCWEDSLSGIFHLLIISSASMDCPFLLKFFTWTPKKISDCAIKFQAQCWLNRIIFECLLCNLFVSSSWNCWSFVNNLIDSFLVRHLPENETFLVVYTNFQIWTSWQHCTEVFTDLFVMWTELGHIQRIKSDQFHQVLSWVDYNFRKPKKERQISRPPKIFWDRVE